MQSSRAAFDLSADLRVIPPVTAATMSLVALSALRRLAIGEDGSVPPLHNGGTLPSSSAAFDAAMVMLSF